LAPGGLTHHDGSTLPSPPPPKPPVLVLLVVSVP